jgi:hypothetical protein
LHEGREAGERIGREPNVGIDKDKQRVTGPGGENMASMHFPAPSLRQLWGREKSHAWIVGSSCADESCRLVRRVVVEHEQLQLDAAGAQDGIDRGANIRSSFRAGMSTEIRGRGSPAAGCGAGR